MVPDEDREPDDDSELDGRSELDGDLETDADTVLGDSVDFDETVDFAEVAEAVAEIARVVDIDLDEFVLVVSIDDAEIEPRKLWVEVALGLQVTRGSVVSAMIAARMDCCWDNQAEGPKSSPIMLAVST